MSVQILGYNGMTEQPRRRRKRMGEPAVDVRTWKGPKAMAERLAAALEAAGTANVEISGNGAGRTVTAEFAASPEGGGGPNSGGEEIKWTCDFEVLNKPIETHPDFRHPAIARSLMVEIKKALDEHDSTKLNDWAATGGTNVREYVKRKLIGEDYYELYIYVVRKTTVTSIQSTIVASFTGINAVTKNDPTAKPNANPFGRARFKFPPGEYKKCPPRVSDVGKGKVEIVEEWRQAEKWDGRFYPGGSWTPEST
jgi:hypothetical protein